MVNDFRLECNRVGGEVAPAVLPHHLAYGSVPRRFLPDHSVSALLPVFLISAQPYLTDSVRYFQL